MLVTLTHADAQAMTACYHAANGLFPPNQRPTATVADFEAILAQNTVLGWREQGLAGFAAYRVHNRLAHLEALYVDIAAGRRGIGAALTQAAISAAGDLGARLCMADCLKNAPWALSFYMKMGFVAHNGGDTAIDDPDALAYLKAHEDHTWSVRLFRAI